MEQLQHLINEEKSEQHLINEEKGEKMKLSQFMQYIREQWGLTPKQAMDKLNLKTLNGTDYRQLLEQLQYLINEEK